MNVNRTKPLFWFTLAFICLIVFFLIIGASGFRGIKEGSHLYQNKGDEGFYIFYRLLEELEYNVQFEKKLIFPKGNKNTIVYLDMNALENEFIDELKEWVSKGNHLLLFSEAINVYFNTDVLVVNDEGFSFKKIFINKLTNYKILNEEENNIKAISLTLGKGSLYIFADRDQFNNTNISDLENAKALDDIFYKYSQGSLLLREKYGKAIFDPSLIKGLFKGHLSIITSHGLIIFFLFLYMNGKRFAKPKNIWAKRIRKITEHIEAVGLFYHKAGATALIEKIDSDYFKWVICKNKKPIQITMEEYSEYIENNDGLDEVQIIERFKIRNKLIRKIRSNTNG